MTYTEAIEYLNKTLPQDEQLIWGFITVET